MKKIQTCGGKTAIADPLGECSYEELADMSLRAARSLQDICSAKDLKEGRVAFMLPRGREYAAVKLGIWLAGGVSVPLCPAHPPKETGYVIGDSEPLVVISRNGFPETVRKLCPEKRPLFVQRDDIFSSAPALPLPDISPSRRAMMIYTSGTASRPKGVVTTHSNICAQINAMVEAWKWTDSDRVLNILPLHHLHGILNLLLCPLSAGAACEMADFESRAVWDRFLSGGITVFMAVPTVYEKLSQFWENAPADAQKAMSAACARMRLMVSGSAPLTVKLSRRWLSISGHTLLERYGMTETGMILSNPLEGKRKPGFVGKPMPGVKAGVFSPDGSPAAAGEAGEIRVRGAGVFSEYWKNPGATANAFSGGWFKTGDIARVDSDGDFQILGRESVDIIKTGGYKVSAFEIEREISGKDGVAGCAVVGVKDEVWGQKVAAAVVLEDGCTLDLDGLKKWLKPRIASYKIPSLLKVMDKLPQNALGKTRKPEISQIWENRT